MVDWLQIIGAGIVSAVVSFATAYGAFRVRLENRLTTVEAQQRRDGEDFSKLASLVSRHEEARKAEDASLGERIGAAVAECRGTGERLVGLATEIKYLEPMKAMLQKYGSAGLEAAITSPRLVDAHANDRRGKI